MDSARTTIALDDRDITADGGGTQITEAGGWVELVLPADLGALGQLTVRIPADDLRAVLISI